MASDDRPANVGGLGRKPAQDSRDKLFPMGALMRPLGLIGVEKPRTRYWNDEGWWGNQGDTSMCVAYAWTHYIEDGPVTHLSTRARLAGNPYVEPEVLYRRAQAIDEWPGENYDGTSVRAGAAVLRERGLVASYHWAFNLTDLVDALLTLGPVVVGTEWYEGMDRPSWLTGLIKVEGESLGGHAYVLNGVNTIAKRFRLKNSWGRAWGKKGRAYIRFDDMERLISEGGEVAIATELPVK